MGTIDRRFVKSEKAIREALVSLLQKRRVFELSLGDLVDAADINRSTFYLHYPSIEAAFSALEDVFVKTWQGLPHEEANSLSLRFLLTVKADRKLAGAVLLNARPRLTEKMFGAYQSLAVCLPKKDELEIYACLGAAISVLGHWARGRFKIHEDKVRDLLEKHV